MTELPFAILTRPELAVPIVVALLIAVGVTVTSYASRVASLPQTTFDRLVRGTNLYGAPFAILVTFFVVTFNGDRGTAAVIWKIVLISTSVTLTVLLALAEVSVARHVGREDAPSSSPSTGAPSPQPAPVTPPATRSHSIAIISAACASAFAAAIAVTLAGVRSRS